MSVPVTAKLAALKTLTAGGVEEIREVPVTFGDWWHKRGNRQVRLLLAEADVKDAEIRLLKAENARLEGLVREQERQSGAEAREEAAEARRRAETAAINARWVEKEKYMRNHPQRSHDDPTAPQYGR